jgi:TonB family protein
MKRLAFLWLGLMISFAESWSQQDIAPTPLNLGEIAAAIGFPSKAEEQGISGRVEIKVKVNEKGKVEAHEIVKSPSPILTEAVEHSIYKLKFRPAQKSGKPSTAWVILPFTFDLPKTTSFNNLNEALSSLGKVKALNLSNQGLKAIDSRITRLESLVELDLSGNQITRIQIELGNLTQLEKLNLAGNPVKTFPKQLKKLKSLKYLNLKGHQLDGKTLSRIRKHFANSELILD